MIKFHDNKLIKNIFILLLSGLITKIIGMLGKIIYTRIAGINIVSLYTMLMPTFMLIITICQFSLPLSVSKLVAEGKHDDKKILIAAYKIGYIIDIILMSLILILSKKLSLILKNEILFKPILSMIFIIPFVTTTSIQRGFLHGKEKMLPNSISNIIEEIVKMILIILLLPISVNISNEVALIFIILFNLVTEIISIIIMNIEIKKYIRNKNVKYDKKIEKEIINISLPTTLIKLIGSLCFFLEPIILNYTLTKSGLSKDYILLEYGIINSYIIPVLSMPSFFFLSISSALLPNLTKEYKNKNHKKYYDKITKLTISSLINGIISLTVLLIFPNEILNLIYKQNYGINYLYILGPFFILLYLNPTMQAAILSAGKTNKLFFISIISNLFKYSSLFILGVLGLGIYSLIFSIIIGIIISTILSFYTVIKK